MNRKDNTWFCKCGIEYSKEHVASCRVCNPNDNRLIFK